MKKKMLKRVVSTVMTAGCILSLAGCGGKQAPNTSPTGEPAGQSSGQTLKVLLSEEPGQEDALAVALRTWAEETGNKIETVVISDDDMLTKFPAMAKNKDLPDLIHTTRLHQLYPDEFIDVSTVVDISKFNESAVKIVGKSYSSDKVSGVPEQFTITCMYYNKDAFVKAGIEVPTAENPWTWEEFYENAQILKEQSDCKYGFAADVSRARYDILMYANGGSLVERAGDTFAVAVNSPQNIATLEAFVAANNNGIMPKAIWAGGSTDNPVEYFKNGDAAMLLSGSWNYNAFTADITKFEFGVMPTPQGSMSQAAVIGGAALAVPVSGKNQEAAAAFLTWFYEAEHYQSFLQNHKGLSVLDQVLYQPDGEKAQSDFGVMQAELDFVTDSFMTDEASSWRTFKDNEYRDSLKRAVAGELTAQEALDEFAKVLAKASGWELAE